MFNVTIDAGHAPHRSLVYLLNEPWDLAYVENFKAASTSIRSSLPGGPMRGLVCNSDWHIAGYLQNSNLPRWEKRVAPKGNEGCCDFTLYPAQRTTECLGGSDVDRPASMYRAFSFVREPIAKFEAGVREAWAQDCSLRNLSADRILRMQLGAYPLWVNDHLMPSSYTLSAGTLLEPQPMRFAFIGRIEAAGEDWRHVRELIPQAALPVELPTTHATAFVKAKGTSSAHAGPSDRLSPAGQHLFCSSWLFGRDFAFFGYERPARCAPPSSRPQAARLAPPRLGLGIASQRGRPPPMRPHRRNYSAPVVCSRSVPR